MTHVAHWDDVPAETADLGAIGGTWRELSTAVGSVALGVSRIELPPAAPLHCHSTEEEFFVVLEGDGLALLMFSDKHPNDMCFYPRTGKVTLRGLGITFKPEIVPWFDA